MTKGDQTLDCLGKSFFFSKVFSGLSNIWSALGTDSFSVARSDIQKHLGLARKHLRSFHDRCHQVDNRIPPKLGMKIHGAFRVLVFEPILRPCET